MLKIIVFGIINTISLPIRLLTKYLCIMSGHWKRVTIYLKSGDKITVYLQSITTTSNNDGRISKISWTSTGCTANLLDIDPNEIDAVVYK